MEDNKDDAQTEPRQAAPDQNTVGFNAPVEAPPQANDGDTSEAPPPWAITTPPLSFGASGTAPVTEQTSIPGFGPGDLVTYKAQNGQIVGVHADGTYDVQILNEAGEPKKAGSGQPLWYERVPATEIEER